MKTVGSKAEVFHGSAKHTSGGLTRKNLMKTKSGRIVSRKKHAAGKKAIQRLFKLGFKPKKGTFRLFSTSSKRTTRKTRGGVGASVLPVVKMPSSYSSSAPASSTSSSSTKGAYTSL